MPINPLPADPSELNQLYDETLETHHNYLIRLQEAFDKHCSEIGDKTKEKLSDIPKEDKETRQEFLAKEQKELDKALAELKEVVNRSGASTRKKLEEIETKRESLTMNLEEELANV